MFSFGSEKNADDSTKHGSSAVDDDGTDETHPEETLFLDLSEGLHDEGMEETIEFNEMYGSAVPGSVECDESYDPYVRYAYIRKIDGTDFVKKRRVSVLRRRRSIYGIACVILITVATAIGCGIYHLVSVELQYQNDKVALGSNRENHLMKDEHEDESDNVSPETSDLPRKNNKSNDIIPDEDFSS